MIKAKIIADSSNEFGNRLTTMVITFPRYILAEFNTHRMLSKNSASSRAIPFEKLLESVKKTPFIPMAWQKNHSGMQGHEYLNERQHEVLNSAWLVGRDKAIEQAEYMVKYADPTKQMINRMLEAYMYHTCIVSGTEWENFFALRCPQYEWKWSINGEVAQTEIFRSKKDWLRFARIKNAQHNDEFGNSILVEPTTQIDWLKLNKGMADIHMMELAECMWDALNESIPKELDNGEWHIPFGDGIDEVVINQLYLDGRILDADTSKESLRLKVATARCARVSYTVVGEEGKPHNYENDIKLHDRLSKSGHWSCFEHCARVMDTNEYELSVNGKLEWTNGQYTKPFPTKNSEGWSGNFRGFIQYRKMFNNENVT